LRSRSVDKSRQLFGEEAKNFGRHVIQDVEQVVAGVQDFEQGVGMRGGELARIADGNRIVVRTVENERRLSEIGIVFEALAVGQELITKPAVAVFGVMENFDGAGVTPGGERGGTEAFRPPAREAKGRGEQDGPGHVGMARRIEGGEISAKAGAHERHRFAADGAVDHGELAGDTEALEIALGEIGNIDGGACVLEERPEIPGFRRVRTGSEAVEVDDAGHFNVPLRMQ